MPPPALHCSRVASHALRVVPNNTGQPRGCSPGNSCWCMRARDCQAWPEQCRGAPLHTGSSPRAWHSVYLNWEQAGHASRWHAHLWGEGLAAGAATHSSKSCRGAPPAGPRSPRRYARRAHDAPAAACTQRRHESQAAAATAAVLAALAVGSFSGATIGARACVPVVACTPTNTCTASQWN